MSEYDSPNFAEFAYEVKNEGKIKVLRRIAIAGYVLFGLAYFIIACAFQLYPVIAIMPLFVRILVFFTWGYVCYDNYFEFNHGEMEFGTTRNAGKNGKKKRPILNLTVKNARAARLYRPEDEEIASVQKIYDFSESQSSDKRIVIFFEKDGVPSAVIFEGTSKVANLIARFCEGGASLKGEKLHG